MPVSDFPACTHKKEKTPVSQSHPGTGIPAVPPFLAAKTPLTSFPANAGIRRDFSRMLRSRFIHAAKDLSPAGLSLHGAFGLLFFFYAQNSFLPASQALIYLMLLQLLYIAACRLL